MLQKASVRFRYIYSLLLIMIPILIFSVIVYTSTQSNSMQYINSSSLQNFTYATSNLSSVLSRLDYAAKTAFVMENSIQLDEENRVQSVSDSTLCAALKTLEERSTPEVTALYYIKGEKYIYSSQGRMLYGVYENENLRDYNLSLSALYTKIQQITSPTVLPLVSSANTGILSGLVYAVPFPAEGASNSVLLFVLSDEVIADQFANFMGEVNSSLSRNYLPWRKVSTPIHQLTFLEANSVTCRESVTLR